MTRAPLVLHLVHYDVRRTKWWWVAYVIIVGVATFVARDVDSGSRSTFWDLIAWVLGISVIGFAAVLTRDSSPLDSRAFTAGKPISAMACATAKILQLGVMLLLAAAAAGWAAAPSGWPLQNGVITLLPATMSFLLLLLAGGYVGLVTPTMTATVLVWVLGGVSAIVAMSLDGLGDLLPKQTDVWLLALLVALCSMASVLLFARLANPRFRRLSVAGGVALVAVSLTGQCAVLAAPLTKAESPSAVEPLVERASLIQFGDSSISSNIISMRITPLRDDRFYRFENGTFVCEGRNADGATSLDESEVHGIDDYPPEPWVRTILNVPGYYWKVSAQAPLDRAVISVGSACGISNARVDRVTLRGSIVRYRLERIVERPFRVGPLTRGGGQRWWLRRGDEGLELRLSTLLIRTERRAASATPGSISPLVRPVIIVVDSTARQAYRLDQGGYGMALAPVVLPALYREYGWYALRGEPEVEQLLGAKTARAGVAMYRWVKDGEITVSFERRGGSWFQRSRY